jgi:hypothetical protein
MHRGELERLSKEELSELVLRLQRPEKTLAHLLQAALDGEKVSDLLPHRPVGR